MRNLQKEFLENNSLHTIEENTQLQFVWVHDFRRESQGNDEHKNFFDSSCCTGPDRYTAGCSQQKWIALLKTLDFSFLAARFFFHFFFDPFLDGVNSGSQEPRTAQNSLRVSGSLQPRGRWARSGSQQSAGNCWCCPACWYYISWCFSLHDVREQLACEAVSSGSQQFAGVGGGATRCLIVQHTCVALRHNSFFWTTTTCWCWQVLLVAHSLLNTC